MAIVKSRFFIPLIVFFSFLFLYIHNLSNSVYGGDVGDLVTAAYLHGVPHAPGYPLFTLVGYLLTRIVPMHTPAWRVGLISAFSGALGLVFFYLLLQRLTKSFFASLLTTCLLGVTFFYWFYAEIAEVFELHIFFTILLFYLAVLFHQTKKYTYGLLLFFVFGLSCTNHQTTVLLFPSLFLIVFPELKRLWKNKKTNIVFLFLAIIVGFIPYIYIPIASNTHPALNWDNVRDLQSFFHLVLRMDYGTFQAGGFGSISLIQRLVSVKVYSLYLLTQLTIPVILLCFFGMWEMAQNKKQRVYLYALTVTVLLTGPCFIFYAGFPLTDSFTFGVYERFFIMSAVVLLMSFPFGLIFISQKLASMFPKRSYAVLFQTVFLLIPLALLLYNYPKTNLSVSQLGDNYAKDILNTLPPHAFLIVSGDTLAFNTWYAHFALHVRPDVSVYNFGGGTSDITVGKGKDKKSSSDILLDAFKKINTFRPVYSTLALQPKNGKNLTWVPYGFSLKLLKDNETIPSHEAFNNEQEILWSHMHIPTQQEREQKVNHDLTISQIPIAYSNAMVTLATFYYTHFQDTKNAEYYYDMAINIAPDNANAYLGRGVYFMGEQHNCKNVISNLSTSLSINPFQKPAYFLLYNAYKSCGASSQLANSVKKSFVEIFQQNFDKEAKTELKSLNLSN